MQQSLRCWDSHFPPPVYPPRVTTLSCPQRLPGPKWEKMRKIKCIVSVNVLMSVPDPSRGSVILGAKLGKQTKPEIPRNS